MRRKQRWSWKRWLEAVEQCDLLSDADRQLADAFMRAGKKRPRKTIVPWMVEGNPGYSDFHMLTIAGFAYLIPGYGQFFPILDPLPGPNTIILNPDARSLIRSMLKPSDRFDGGLYRINIAGHINKRNDRRRWCLRSASQDVWPRAAMVNRLVKLGVIEPDGTGHGWPTQYTSRFRINWRRIAGVRGFRAMAMRHIAEQQTVARAAA